MALVTSLARFCIQLVRKAVVVTYIVPPSARRNVFLAVYHHHANQPALPLFSSAARRREPFQHLFGDDSPIRVRARAQAFHRLFVRIEMKQSPHTRLFARLLRKGLSRR